MQLPFRLNDLLLVIVVISSMTIAIIFPDFGSLFHAFPVYCMMILFSLSYLSIEFPSVWKTFKGQRRQILIFTIFKLAILPVIMFYVFDYFAPDYALSALLLTGISTGVVAPFISNLVKGNNSFVLVFVVITSVLTPFTLPALIQIIIVKQVEISLIGMIRMLMLVIFVPILIVEFLKRFEPGLVNVLLKRQFPLSLVLFTITNLGIFYRYAPILKKEPSIIITAFVMTVVLTAILCITGIFFFWKSSVENQLAGAIVLANMNNVLSLVFSSEFFGTIEPLVSGIYTIPFFGLVIPLRYYYLRKTKTE